MRQSRMGVCNNCGLRRPIRTNGTCFSCLTPDGSSLSYVEAAVYQVSQYKRPDADDLAHIEWSELDNTDDRPMASPTRALPGTPAKVQELENRFDQRLHLWSPFDAKHHLD